MFFATPPPAPISQPNAAKSGQITTETPQGTHLAEPFVSPVASGLGQASTYHSAKFVQTNQATSQVFVTSKPNS